MQQLLTSVSDFLHPASDVIAYIYRTSVVYIRRRHMCAVATRHWIFRKVQVGATQDYKSRLS